MNRIYGIGLPRTGTTSLAIALKKLGHTTRHFCILHDSEHFKYDSPDVTVFIDNSFYAKCKETIEDILLTKHKNSLFILTKTYLCFPPEAIYSSFTPSPTQSP